MNKSPSLYRGLMIVLLLVCSIGHASIVEEDLVYVGLASGMEEIGLAGDGEIILQDMGSSGQEFFPCPGDQGIITAVAENIYINELPVSSGPLLVISPNSLLTWEGRCYRGQFLVTNQNGKLNLINRLPLEEYLRGVVPKEIPAGWPMAALKAQAIAARTYTLVNLGRHQEDGFHLCATTHCQVYQGLSGEHPHTDLAVSETKGKVIAYNGQLISAVYHDSSGGYTKDASEVWSQAVPYLIPAPGWDNASPYHHWTRSIDWRELQGQISKSYPKVGDLKQLLPAGFGSDGRIIKLTVKGTMGEITITGEQFRHVVGLPSSNMKLGIVYGPEPLVTLWWSGERTQPEVPHYSQDAVYEYVELWESVGEHTHIWPQLQEKIPIRVEIHGAGRGHGVGLSQWGAKGMAEAGYDEKQILEHFYPGAIVTDMTALQKNVGEIVSDVSQ